MRQKSSIKLITQPQDYFRSLVVKALDRQKVFPLPETEVYLVELLFRFMSTDELFACTENGKKKEEALAEMLKEALEEELASVQWQLFRHMGDVSLYFAAFFEERLAKKRVDIDYYIQMGGAAYQHAALRTEELALQKVFDELGRQFKRFVDVLSEVRGQTFGKTEKDLLRIYDHWVETQSKRSQKILEKAGIVPQSRTKKKWL